MFALVQPEDILAGLAAAGIDITPPANLLEDAASTATRLANAVVSSLVVPTIPEMGASMKRFDRLEQAISALIDQLGGDSTATPAERSDSQPAIDHYLRDNGDLFIHNLTLHIDREAGPEAGRAALADTVLHLHRVRAACRSASEVQKNLIKSEHTARDAPEMRSRQRELGFAFLATFQGLTGRELKISRASGGEHVGRLGGPLIRFMTEMFSQVRANLSTALEMLHLVDDPAWSPSPETIRRWIQVYQRHWDSTKTATATDGPTATGIM